MHRLLINCLMVIFALTTSQGLMAKKKKSNSCQRVTVQQPLASPATAYPVDFYLLPGNLYLATFAREASANDARFHHRPGLVITDVVVFNRGGSVISHHREPAFSQSISEVSVLERAEFPYNPVRYFPLSQSDFYHLVMTRQYHPKGRNYGQTWTSFLSRRDFSHTQYWMKTEEFKVWGPNISPWAYSMAHKSVILREFPAGSNISYLGRGPLSLDKFSVIDQNGTVSTLPFSIATYTGISSSGKSPKALGIQGVFESATAGQFYAWGSASYFDKGQGQHGWLMMIDMQGKVIWSSIYGTRRYGANADLSENHAMDTLMAESSQPLLMPDDSLILVDYLQKKKKRLLRMAKFDAAGKMMFASEMPAGENYKERSTGAGWSPVASPSISALKDGRVVILKGNEVTILDGKTGKQKSTQTVFGDDTYQNARLLSHQDQFPERVYSIAVKAGAEPKPAMMVCSK
ncbi:hypothetical protein [Spongorhabdus nitratireducens]